MKNSKENSSTKPKASLAKAERTARTAANSVYALMAELRDHDEASIARLQEQRDHVAKLHDDARPQVERLMKRATRTKRRSDVQKYGTLAQRQRHRREQYHHTNELISEIKSGGSFQATAQRGKTRSKSGGQKTKTNHGESDKGEKRGTAKPAS
jgi:hypothetical protein